MFRHSRKKLRGLLFSAGLCCLCCPSVSFSADRPSEEPGWLPVVFARGALREEIDATPIELRPYRPLHFYGNTVRRLHYRGTPWPRFQEVLATPVRIVRRPSQEALANFRAIRLNSASPQQTQIAETPRARQ